MFFSIKSISLMLGIIVSFSHIYGIQSGFTIIHKNKDTDYETFSFPVRLTLECRVAAGTRHLPLFGTGKRYGQETRDKTISYTYAFTPYTGLLPALRCMGRLFPDVGIAGKWASEASHTLCDKGKWLFCSRFYLS
ncbi:unknown [Bacteroides sp. CAG:702]|nr:unknown [Bacteroides sp. CAG:702]